MRRQGLKRCASATAGRMPRGRCDIRLREQVFSIVTEDPCGLDVIPFEVDSGLGFAFEAF